MMGGEVRVMLGSVMVVKMGGECWAMNTPPATYRRPVTPNPPPVVAYRHADTPTLAHRGQGEGHIPRYLSLALVAISLIMRVGVNINTSEKVLGG
jgi:hypothetical protein